MFANIEKIFYFLFCSADVHVNQPTRANPYASMLVSLILY